MLTLLKEKLRIHLSREGCCEADIMGTEGAAEAISQEMCNVCILTIQQYTDPGKNINDFFTKLGFTEEQIAVAIDSVKNKKGE